MLADPKYQRLNAAERSCWITLLCLASLDEGNVRHCEESYLIGHSGIDPASNDWHKCHGVLMKFEMLGMISRARDDRGIEYLVVKNWQKRQEHTSESYERVKKHREKQRLLAQSAGTVTPVTLQSNVRVEKNRVEKNRNKSEVADAPAPEPVDLELATLLRDRIKTNTPTFKEPNLGMWSRNVRLMRERDKRTPEQIRYLIEWSQKDPFWQANILSTSKLRDKFDTLVAQVKRKVNVETLKKSNVAFV